VLSAYEHHCAICDLQLDLLVAAHIIPVESPESNDSGMALRHLHHEAYDSALVGVDESYRVLLNEHRVRRLERKKHVYGLEPFVSALRPEIRLPVIAANRPRPEYLRLGMELRRWVRH